MLDVKLSEHDKEELLEFLDSYAKKISPSDIEEINNKLDKKISTLRKKKNLPSYVPTMIEQMKDLSLLLDSSDIIEDRLNKAIAALHYFIWSEDRIPDYIPIIGYLDDAFVISVVYHEVKNDITKTKRSKGWDIS